MNAPPVPRPARLERASSLAVLADRERIARDLNDRVIQQIFSVGLDLQGTIARSRSEEITARLNQSVADLHVLIQDIRNTVFELHVTRTPRVGFRHRIEAAVAELTENRDIATTLRISGPMSVIDDELAGHAEWVILEAISYAVRYSEATKLTVVVTVADELDVAITDDGCGVTPDKQGHSGLVNLASRAEQIGGDFHLTTPLGGGTKVNWTHRLLTPYRPHPKLDL